VVGPTPQPPILLVVRDDLERSRLTVGFRWLLAIPHLVWLALWLSLATLVAFANGIATLFSGKPSPSLHRFLAAYLRYAVHVGAYVGLAANPFPAFTGAPGRYPVDVEVQPPATQRRWVTGFRLVLALPSLLLADSLMGLGTSLAAGAGTYSGGVAGTVAFFSWFVCVVRGRMPEGFRNLLCYALGYAAQVGAYLFLITDRYPNSDPALYESVNTYRDDAIRMSVDDDLRRSRLTVLFRLILAVPHFAWLTLWGIAGLLVAAVNWFATLIRGRSLGWAHRFLAALLRYQTHVYAFVQLVGNPFPGFAGREGSYPVDIEIDPPLHQRRLVTGFRLILAVPALVVASALNTVATLAAAFGWFASLATGRMPRGLRNLSAYSLRYNAQVTGYAALLTERYAFSGPEAGRQLRLAPRPRAEAS
jgi:hypothetical protein